MDTTRREHDSGTDWFRVRRWLAYFGSGALIWTTFVVHPPETAVNCAARNPTEIWLIVLSYVCSFLFLSLGFDRWKRTERTKVAVASCALFLLGLTDLVSTLVARCPTPPGALFQARVGGVLRLCYLSLAIITYQLAIRGNPISTSPTSDE